MSKLIIGKFTEREVYAIWSALCVQHTVVPWTANLKCKLYDMMKEKRVYELADKYDRHLVKP